MSTPLRSRSSSRGDEVQALLQETRRLKEENDVLRIQVSSEPPRCQQRRSLRCNQEAMYPGNASPSLDAHGVWPGEGPVPTHRAPQEESSDFTHISSKGKREKDLPISQGHATHQPVSQVDRDSLNATPPGSISRQLDDMLSTPFSFHIIDYEPPREFIVPKFSAYDGSSDPFNHIMHYR
ncbi:hypothetical protein AAG906_007764 [Vitis piasezkii]